MSSRKDSETMKAIPRLMRDRLRQVLDDTNVYVERSQEDLPKNIIKEIEDQHKALREGKLSLDSVGLRDYFQVAGEYGKWWVSTGVEGISKTEGEVPRTRVAIVAELLRDLL